MECSWFIFSLIKCMFSIFHMILHVELRGYDSVLLISLFFMLLYSYRLISFVHCCNVEERKRFSCLNYLIPIICSRSQRSWQNKRASRSQRSCQGKRVSRCQRSCQNTEHIKTEMPNQEGEQIKYELPQIDALSKNAPK